LGDAGAGGRDHRRAAAVAALAPRRAPPPGREQGRALALTRCPREREPPASAAGTPPVPDPLGAERDSEPHCRALRTHPDPLARGGGGGARAPRRAPPSAQ